MSALILDGSSVAQSKKVQIKKTVDAFSERYQRTPGLAVVLVGADPASKIYVHRKKAACEAVGIHSIHYHFPENIDQQELLDTIDTLNKQANVDGILVQLPLPSHIDSTTIINRISPRKDVDGFHPLNIGKLTLKQPSLRSCTPKGVMELLQAYQIPVEGKHAVIVGASNIVGRPMALELLKSNATVTICHRKTKNLAQFIKMSELLIVAIGNPNVIQPDWLTKDQVIVDVGINRLDNHRICGDVPFESARKIVQAITPVPGGVGPMTIISLLENCLLAAQSIESS